MQRINSLSSLSYSSSSLSDSSSSLSSSEILKINSKIPDSKHTEIIPKINRGVISKPVKNSDKFGIIEDKLKINQKNNYDSTNDSFFNHEIIPHNNMTKIENLLSNKTNDSFFTYDIIDPNPPTADYPIHLKESIEKILNNNNNQEHIKTPKHINKFVNLFKSNCHKIILPAILNLNTQDPDLTKKIINKMIPAAKIIYSDEDFNVLTFVAATSNIANRCKNTDYLQKILDQFYFDTMNFKTKNRYNDKLLSTLKNAQNIPPQLLNILYEKNLNKKDKLDRDSFTKTLKIMNEKIINNNNTNDKDSDIYKESINKINILLLPEVVKKLSELPKENFDLYLEIFLENVDILSKLKGNKYEEYLDKFFK